jgi:hypothetical protein
MQAVKHKRFIWLLALVAVIAIFGVKTLAGNRVTKDTAGGYVINPPADSTNNPPYTQCNQYSAVEYLSYPEYSSFTKPNNKFGIYIYAEEDRFFKLAEKMVNSNGGDWGYVLIPYNVKDRDWGKWKNVFDNLTSRHLIPIVQLWYVDTAKYKSDTKESAAFLDSFIWPVKERYISVYNEPNDDKFWKGVADAKNYAKILAYTIDAYKQENPNFFMLNGALNASAPDGNGYINPLSFMQQMNQAVPGIFDKLDGWASHSYPQPNFAGDPYDTGLWSIKAYEVELNYLKTALGVKKELPVFITETGWAHAEGTPYNGSYFNAATVAQKYKAAFEDVWLKDDRVRAVTPFTILYDPPNDHFSWVNSDGVPYEQYEMVKKLKKIKGEPAGLQKTQMAVSNCTKEEAP